MATKTIDHMDFYVEIKPYTTEGNGDQVFDVLNVSVSYRKGRGFRADYHPGWKTGWGGFGCVIDFSQNPLTAATYVDIDPTATKNNVRRLEQYKANLQLAAKGIAAYFDARNFAGLNTFIEGVALYGYTQHHKDSADFVAMKNAENNSNNQTSEDKTMNTNETKNENKNVAMEAQVNNVKTDVDIAEVDDIVPVVTAKPKAKPAEKPAVTMPLGKHGTLVIAGVGGTKADVRGKTEDAPQTSDIKPQTSTKVQDSVPATGKLTYATYEKTKINKTTKKEYTVTHAKIMGFTATDEAYQRGVELHGAASGEMVDGVKVLALYFSHRYAAAAKDVCDALNEGKPFAECVAIIDNATEENARKREEWKAKIEERKQKREERKAAKNQPSAVSPQTSGEKSYTLDEVATMLGKLLPNGAASTEDIKKLLQAA